MKFLSYTVGIITVIINMPFVVIGFVASMICGAVGTGWEVWEALDEAITRGIEG